MFEQKSIQKTISELGSDASLGLSLEEVQKRLEKTGKNCLKEARPQTILEQFTDQLNDPLIFILFAAAAISFILGELGDACIVMIVISMNACIGVIQEGKAKKALDALKKLTSLKALVTRDGVEIEIDAEQLVPGDIVILEAGRQVPADLRLIQSSNLKIEEASLTGESVPVEKSASFLTPSPLPPGDCKNMAYMTTNVTYGRGKGIVTATGMQTEIGKIAGFINDAPDELTTLQKRLGDLGKLLSTIAVALCAALFLIAVFQKRNIIEMFITAISLAVAAVPEGLPAVVTIVLALSVSRMVKVHTIVRRLPSVETLGSVSIVCSDKTGTLTQNKMTVTSCYTDFEFMTPAQLDRSNNREFLECFLLCNDAILKNRIGDPTELALLDIGNMHGLNRTDLEQNSPRIQELPFDSDRKMMTTLHKCDNKYYSYTKGASDEIIKRCSHVLIAHKQVPITAEHKASIQNAIAKMSSQALRVLAAAMRIGDQAPQENSLTFIGLAGMIDPARPEAINAVGQFQKASVKTVMITGDQKETAFAIAKELGIANAPSQCITGQELDTLSDEIFYQRLPSLTVFARVTPAHKVRIVSGFQHIGHTAAMTGDGINDAPSLKKADIGIAMGLTGTDVAKQASDLILADDNFATIEKAIEEGRSIYENIKKSVLFLLSSNFGEIITMFTAILFGLSAPLKASHILWINLITDSLPALALGVDENDREHLMNKPPRGINESLFSGGGLACTFFYGILIGAISLAAFFKVPGDYLSALGQPQTLEGIRFALSQPELLNRAQTYAFTVLGLSQLFHAVGMRDVEKSVFQMNHFSNKLMILSWIIGFFLQFIVTEIPYFISVFGTVRLSIREWSQLIFLASMPLIAHELFYLQTWFRSRIKRDKTSG